MKWESDGTRKVVLHGGEASVEEGAVDTADAERSNTSDGDEEWNDNVDEEQDGEGAAAETPNLYLA